MTSPHRAQDEVVADTAAGLVDGDGNAIAIATETSNAPTIPDNLTAMDIAAPANSDNNGFDSGMNSNIASVDPDPKDEASPAFMNGGNVGDYPMDGATPDFAMQTQTSQPPAPVASANVPLLPSSDNGDGFDHNLDAQALLFMQAAMPVAMPFDMPVNGAYLNGNYESSPPPQDKGIAAYAALEFPDGTHYMNTTRIVLGRDNALYREVLADEARAAQMAETGKTEASDGPRTPQPKAKSSRQAKSIVSVSQSGGFFRKFDKGMEDRRRKKKSKKSKGSNSSDQQVSRRNSIVAVKEEFNYELSARDTGPGYDNEAPAPVTDAHKPDPDHEITLGIHPPPDRGSEAFKKISRKHCLIAYNYQEDRFELEVFGTNGLFINTEYHEKGSVQALKHNDVIQIGEVEIRFALPDHAEDDGYVTTENGKEISFGFESSPRDPKLFVDSGDSDNVLTPLSGNNDEDDEDGESDEQNEEEDEDDEQEGDDVQDEDDGEEEEEEDGDEKRPTIELPKPERRGPGRPPKNGIMSKKKERELQREQQEEAARRASDGSPTVTKNKVGRPRKHPRPEDEPGAVKEKRKYTKRAPKEPGAEGEEGPKEKKKTEKRPRSPSPEGNESDFTPEQLAKPQANYVQLIFDALKDRPEGKMSLPQIYRAIARKYPYFRFKVSTVGWQSSVRHNLSQNDAFDKVERDGKGWMWALVEGADVTKEKKKKTPPPPPMPPNPQQYHALYSGHPPHVMYSHMGPPPPGHIPGPMPPNMRPGYPPYPPGPLPPNGYTMPPQNYAPPPLPPPPPVGQQGYSSPYAQKPPAAPQPPPSSLGPDRRMSSGPPQGPPHQPLPPQSRPPVPQGPPPVDESVGRAVEIFRGSLVNSLSGKSDRAELVVKSAIDRVLGIRTESLVPGDPHEDKIMEALRSVLSKMPGSQQLPPQNGVHQSPATQPQNMSGAGAQSPAPVYAPPQYPGHGPPSASSATSKPSTPSMPSIARPSLGGPSRPAMGMSRPPMMTPGMSRTNSGSPVPKTYSASPAPQNNHNAEGLQSYHPPPKVEASTSSSVPQNTTCSPPILDSKEGIINGTDSGSNGVLQQNLNAGNDSTNKNGKRSLSQDDSGMGEVNQPEPKKQNQGLTS